MRICAENYRFFDFFCLKISVVRLPSAAASATHDSWCDFGKTHRGSKGCMPKGAFFFFRTNRVTRFHWLLVYNMSLLVKRLKKDVTVEQVLQNGCISVTSFVFFLLFEGVEVEAKSPPGTLQFLNF